VDTFFLDDIPRALEAEDGINQDEVLKGVYQYQDMLPGVTRTFETEKVFKVKLHTLRNIFQRKDEFQALNLTRGKRVRIDLDNDSVLESKAPDLLWHCHNYFLDYLLIVSSKIGMHAILPPIRVTSDPQYTFRLQLDQPFRGFPTKFAQLGFDPKGRMLFIGMQNQDNVWLGMMPRHVFRGEGEEIPAGTCSGPTQMKGKHYRAILSWLGHILHRLGIQEVYMRVPYPNIESMAQFKNDTNIL
jgi:hypothetical protein